jgi:hypothetical protein
MALDAVWPAQLADGLRTLRIIDQILDIDLHAGNPVRDGGIGWPQYTPSSNATTPETNKCDPKIGLDFLYVCGKITSLFS